MATSLTTGKATHGREANITIWRATAWCLIAVVGLSALPNGSVDSWAWSSLAVSAVLLLAAAYLDRNARATSLRPLAPAAVMAALLVLWVAAQTLVPASVATATGFWAPAREALSDGSVSIDPDATWEGLVRLLAYITLFATAYCLAHSRRVSQTLLRGFVAAMCLVVAFGATMQMGAPTGQQLVANQGMSGVFPDRNFFATYAGLGLLASVALLARPKLRADDLSGDRESRLRVILSFYVARAWPSLTAVAIMLAAIARSESRAGLAAAGIGLLVFIAVRCVGRLDRSGRMSLKLAGGMVVLILVLAAGGTMDRLSIAGNAASERSEIYASIVNGIAASPVTGIGYGNFQKGFGAFRSDRLPRDYEHGHNIYLENAFELGLPGIVLMVGSFLWLLVLLFRLARDKSADGTFAALGSSAICLVGIHSLVDSTLRIPALAALFAALLGLCIGAGFQPRTRHSSRDR